MAIHFISNIIEMEPMVDIRVSKLHMGLSNMINKVLLIATIQSIGGLVNGLQFTYNEDYYNFKPVKSCPMAGGIVL